MKELLTRKRALELFRQQWTDMQKELGDCPSKSERSAFKYRWINKHMTGDDRVVSSYCFLCEYGTQRQREVIRQNLADKSKAFACDFCPIDWQSPSGDCMYFSKNNQYVNYVYSRISEILALPEKEACDDTNETV